jgi:hypothetical protein
LKVYAPVRSGYQTWSNIGSIFVVKNSGFWRLSQNPLVKHGAFVCSIDAAHQDLSDDMFILGVRPLVMVPEWFKSIDVQLFGGENKTYKYATLDGRIF